MPRISFLQIVGYLESLAEKHIQIKDYFRWNVHEIEGSLRSGIELPVMFIDPVEVKPSGDSAKTFHANSTAITVLGRPNNNTGDLDAYAAQNNVLDHCQQICFDLEERILTDAAIPRINGQKNWLYGLVDKNSFQIIKVGPLFTDQLYGYRFELTLKNSVSMVLDKSKWKDLTNPSDTDEGLDYELDMLLN